MNKLALTLAPLVVFSIVLSGCGGGSTNGPATVKVSGTLKVGGAPKANVQITLSPIGEGLQAASGNTDDSGRFMLTTGQTGTPGAMKGKYKVVLRSLAGEDDSYMNQTEDNTQRSESGNETVEPDQSNGEIPKKYEKKETSDKEIEITGATSDLVIEIE